MRKRVVVVVVVVVVAAVAMEEVAVTAVAMEVAMAVARVVVTAGPVTPATLTAVAVERDCPAIMPARPFATVVKAETTMAVNAAVIAVKAQRLQASPNPEIRAASPKPVRFRPRLQAITTRKG